MYCIVQSATLQYVPLYTVLQSLSPRRGRNKQRMQITIPDSTVLTKMRLQYANKVKKALIQKKVFLDETSQRFFATVLSYLYFFVSVILYTIQNKKMMPSSGGHSKQNVKFLIYPPTFAFFCSAFQSQRLYCSASTIQFQLRQVNLSVSIYHMRSVWIPLCLLQI